MPLLVEVVDSLFALSVVVHRCFEEETQEALDAEASCTCSQITQQSEVEQSVSWQTAWLLILTKFLKNMQVLMVPSLLFPNLRKEWQLWLPQKTKKSSWRWPLPKIWKLPGLQWLRKNRVWYRCGTARLS